LKAALGTVLAHRSKLNLEATMVRRTLLQAESWTDPVVAASRASHTLRTSSEPSKTSGMRRRSSAPSAASTSTTYSPTALRFLSTPAFASNAKAAFCAAMT
jgi:hypothetical protein